MYKCTNVCLLMEFLPSYINERFVIVVQQTNHKLYQFYSFNAMGSMMSHTTNYVQGLILRIEPFYKKLESTLHTDESIFTLQL